VMTRLLDKAMSAAMTENFTVRDNAPQSEVQASFGFRFTQMQNVSQVFAIDANRAQYMAQFTPAQQPVMTRLLDKAMSAAMTENFTVRDNAPQSEVQASFGFRFTQMQNVSQVFAIDANRAQYMAQFTPLSSR